MGGGCRTWENGGAAGEEEEQKKGILLVAGNIFGRACHVTKSALLKP